MSSQKATIDTLVSVNNIINARNSITESMVGESTIVSVRGTGTVTDVKNKAGEPVMAADGTGQLLRKRIINVYCNSDIAIKSVRNQAILREGYAAELAGNKEKAIERYNTYLNKTQVSVGVLSTHSLFNAIANGDEIRGRVQLITTENGSILTLDPKSLAIKQAKHAPSTKVDLLALMAVEVPAQEGATEDVTDKVDVNAAAQS